MITSRRRRPTGEGPRRTAQTIANGFEQGLARARYKWLPRKGLQLSGVKVPEPPHPYAGTKNVFDLVNIL